MRIGLMHTNHQSNPDVDIKGTFPATKRGRDTFQVQIWSIMFHQRTAQTLLSSCSFCASILSGELQRHNVPSTSFCVVAALSSDLANNLVLWAQPAMSLRALPLAISPQMDISTCSIHTPRARPGSIVTIHSLFPVKSQHLANQRIVLIDIQALGYGCGVWVLVRTNV